MTTDKKKKTYGIIANPFKNIPEYFGQKKDDNAEQVKEQIDTGKVRKVKDLLFEDD